MQYQKSGRSAVPPRSLRRRWLVLLLLIVLGGVAGGIMSSAGQSSAPEAAGSKPGIAITRTAVVTKGKLVRSIRLTGTTGAENFVSLVTPQLHGSRGGGGRETGAKTYSTGTNTNLTVTSNAGRGTTTSGSSSASSAATGTGGSSSGSSGGTVSSTAGAAGNNQSAALQASTSRVGKPGASSSNASASSSASSSSNTSTASDPLGSTAAALAGTGTAGGGGGAASSEFGLVLQTLVKPGSAVKKGTTVAEFDRQYMMTRLDDYHASVTQTEASVKKLKAEMAVARKAHDQTVEAAKADLDKAKLDIKTTPVLGAIDAERLKLALEEADAQYKQVLAEVKYFDIGQQSLYRNAELDLQQAKIELKRAQTNADRMVMKAAIDGLTVMQNTFRGSEFAQVQEGDQLYPGQPFMQIVDTRKMVINAAVSQVDVEQVRIGLKARVHFDAYPDLELPAHVYAISAITKPGGMRATFVKEVPVRLELDTTDPRVIPDLSVSIDLILQSEEQAVISPLASVFSDGAGKTSFVYVKTPTGFERRDVQLGLANYTSVSVKLGLNAGDVVAAEAPPQEPPKQT